MMTRNQKIGLVVALLVLFYLYKKGSFEMFDDDKHRPPRRLPRRPRLPQRKHTEEERFGLNISKKGISW